MERLTLNDVRFLLALNASEESFMVWARRDILEWDLGEIDLSSTLQDMIRAGWILLTERREEGFADYTLQESLDAVAAWEDITSLDVILYFTDAGYENWQVDDFGITTKRAHFLMFSSPGSATTRVRA
jgi:hypothetical protein